MSRRRFYLPKPGIRESYVELPPDQAHHLRRVLRIGNGEEVELFDGEGGLYLGAVEISGARVRVRDLVPVPRPAAPIPSIVLGVAIIKPARFEWMLEKTAELGVREIVPLEARFSDSRVAESAGPARLARWQRILQQACEQSGCYRLPLIQQPKPVSDWLRQTEWQTGSRYLCCATGKSWNQVMQKSSLVAIGIGPEGGWAAEELSQAEKSGWTFLSLGENTLRAETAAVAAVTLARLAVP